MRIQIFTTGGTIDKVYFDARSEYEVGDPQIAEILRRVGATFEWEVETLLRKDSLDLTDADRAVIAERVQACPCPRIVVTHGTDTMAETAASLGDVGAKTVVFVGSLTPARFRETDAEFNIGFAMGAVQALPAGVYVAMNGRVFEAGRVRKNRAANRFEGEEFAPPAAG
ncbi:MAG: asparaginase domain-containing protein [Rhodothermales bacterium]|nr:asparaginase domain-containing protein [Rhodothermales bacterium]